MKARQQVPWVQFASMVLSYEFPTAILGVGFIVISMVSMGWTILDAAGKPGSIGTVAVLIAVSLAITGVLILVFRFFRWTLLFAAVKEYIRRNKLNDLIDGDTVLLGAGAGGALAVGMVSKALQELGHPIPHTFVIDCQYRGKPKPETGILLPTGFRLPQKKCFIIHSYLGTGRSLECVREVLEIKDALVFSFVISEALVGREDIDHYLIIGERSIIPWGKSSP